MAYDVVCMGKLQVKQYRIMGLANEALEALSDAISAYLCDLCVKYFSPLQLTRKSQRYAEVAEKT